jgi:putative transcriptional regulator
MTLSSLPSDETLLKYAAGTLDAGVALLLRAHLETSRETRTRLAQFDAIGGVLLQAEKPEAMMEGSLDRVMALINREQPAALPPGPPRIGEALPVALADYDVGPWRWISPGVRIARVGGIEASASRVMLMRFAAGTRMLEHSHDGTETTLVVKGSFSDDGVRYGAGSFIEADESIEHQPVVDPEEECICLVAMQGHIKAPFPMGLIARYLMRV